MYPLEFLDDECLLKHAYKAAVQQRLVHGIQYFGESSLDYG